MINLHTSPDTTLESQNTTTVKRPNSIGKTRHAILGSLLAILPGCEFGFEDHGHDHEDNEAESAHDHIEPTSGAASSSQKIPTVQMPSDIKTIIDTAITATQCAPGTTKDMVYKNGMFNFPSPPFTKTSDHIRCRTPQGTVYSMAGYGFVPQENRTSLQSMSIHPVGYVHLSHVGGSNTLSVAQVDFEKVSDQMTFKSEDQRIIHLIGDTQGTCMMVMKEKGNTIQHGPIEGCQSYIAAITQTMYANWNNAAISANATAVHPNPVPAPSQQTSSPPDKGHSEHDGHKH